jgi:hypothetical protein
MDVIYNEIGVCDGEFSERYIVSRRKQNFWFPSGIHQ